MSSVNPRAIALHGIGYGLLFVALQGMSPALDVAPGPGTGCEPGPVSVQGVGYSPRHLALHGFAPKVSTTLVAADGGGTLDAAQAAQAAQAKALHQQILEEDEILILAVAQMIVNGAFV